MQNFDLAPRSVPKKSYEARRKLRPLIEVYATSIIVAMHLGVHIHMPKPASRD